jgi:hypothetical protein
MKPHDESLAGGRVAVLLLGFLGLAAPGLAAVPPQDEEFVGPLPPPDLAAATQDAPLVVHGSLSLRYRFREADGDAEHDGLGILGLDVGDREKDRFTAHFLGRGSVDGNDYSQFAGITDTFTTNWNGRIYDAFLDVHRMGVIQYLRLGRQSFQETPVFATVDGASLVTEELGALRVQLGAYGGVPAHLYESSPHGDWTGGAHAQVRPWDGTRLRLDWMHVTDELTLGTENNDLLGAALWQELGQAAFVHLRTTLLEEEFRDWEASLRATLNQSQTTLQLRYYELLSTQRLLATEFDPYFESAFEYRPYRQADVVASQVFREDLWLDGGIQLRFLRDPGDEASFNHEFQRYFLTPTVDDLVVEDLSLSLTGELWASEGEDFFTYGVELEQDFVSGLTAALGSYYSLYKYELFGGRERDHVRTFFVRLDRAFKELHAGLDYEYERDDFDRYHTVRVSLTWTF